MKVSRDVLEPDIDRVSVMRDSPVLMPLKPIAIRLDLADVLP